MYTYEQPIEKHLPIESVTDVKLRLAVLIRLQSRLPTQLVQLGSDRNSKTVTNARIFKLGYI